MSLQTFKNFFASNSFIRFIEALTGYFYIFEMRPCPELTTLMMYWNNTRLQISRKSS